MTMKNTPCALTLAFVLLFGLLVSSPVKAQLRLVTENYPPFNFQDENGEVTGISTQILTLLLRRTKVPYSIEVLPWKRAYLLALSERNTCVYSTAHTEERDGLFEWVGPLVKNDWVLFSQAGEHETLQTLEDARGLRIGGYPGDAITDFLLQKGFAVEVTGTDESNLKKLLLGRIDLWPSGLAIGRHRSQASGNAGKIVPRINLKSVDVSLACNRQTGQILISILRTELEKMRSDGSLTAVLERFSKGNS